ncbi:MAG: cytochrome c-type biogenesis protein CcmH [Methylobacteriaceae bacterium]|nr:cytochrome c-type biogenesis protein CcmH [Methylobacteriaceae bacterium]MBV9394821.1 cytochrome c-type biogenesis protein CcmH [Methylobacteriaceae bacterium]
MMRAICLALLFSLVALAPAHAVRPDEVLADPQLEARARAISAELRCMVCQNQSIDDSDAPLARDLRLLVRERLKAGDSNDAIRTFLTARYGDFILLKPPLKLDTVLLWAGPGTILLLGALIILMRRSNGNNEVRSGAELTAEEGAELASILSSKDEAQRQAG